MANNNENLDLYVVAQQQFDRALPHLPKLKRGLIDFLKGPIRSVSVHFPVEMDNGDVRTFTGYRVLHSRVRGPGKGGIRYHPDVTEDEVRSSMVGELLDRLFAGDPAALVSHVVADHDIDEAEIDRLRALLERVERKVGQR